MDANQNMPGYELNDELVRLCLATARREPERKAAWVNSMCLIEVNRPPRSNLFNKWNWPVIVAVSVMRMMQMAVNQIIHVVAVRNGGVAAVGTVDVLSVMAFRSQRAFVRVGIADGNGVFIHMVTVRMMQMAIMNIIHVPVMHDGDMPAIFAVDVGMVRVSFAGMGFAHRFWWLVWLFMFVPPISFRINHRSAWAATNVSASNLHEL